VNPFLMLLSGVGVSGQKGRSSKSCAVLPLPGRLSLDEDPP
jgi:hypothetical protein